MSLGSIILGLFFVLFPGLLLLHQLLFRYKSKTIKGNVAGIEFYKAVNHRSGTQAISYYYRPIIEFQYEGRSYKINGIGSSTIPYRIGDKVKLLSLGKGPEFVSSKKSNNLWILIPSLLIISGLGIIIYHINQLVIDKYHTMGFVFSFLGFITAGGLLFKKYTLIGKGKSQFFNQFQKSRLLTEDDFNGGEDSVFYWSNLELNKLTQKHGKKGLYISISLFLASIFVQSWSWKNMVIENRRLLKSVLNNFDMELLVSSFRSVAEKDKLFVLFFIAVYMTIIGLWSLLYSLKKAN